MAECMTPFTIRNRLTNESQAVPCGRCPSCVKRRVSQWSFRLMQEEKVSSSAHFITLTYDTKHSPITRAGYMSLNKRDIQLFFKRLRKTNLERLKYYAVGNTVVRHTGPIITLYSSMPISLRYRPLGVLVTATMGRLQELV